MKEIKAIELTRENFKDYGYVLSKEDGEPLAKNEELTYWGKVSCFGMSESVSTGILYNHKRDPIIKKFERHVKTPEVLVALEGDSIICLAKSTCNPDKDTESVKAFYIKQGDAIGLHAGTWHWVPIPINCEKSKFLVVFANGTEDNDMDFSDLVEGIQIKY